MTATISYQGTTGAAGVDSRVVFFPSKEGRAVSGASVGDDGIEIVCYARSATQSRQVFIEAMAQPVLTRDGKRTSLNEWSLKDFLMKDLERLATSAQAYLIASEVVLSPEELGSMFSMAKHELLKMAAVVSAELFISDLSREEMAEAWDSANVLHVMQG